jgi:HNH endonuclease
LCLTSVLLMPSGWTDCPPVRAKVLSTVLENLGLSTIPHASVAERYVVFMDILDSLIKFSQNYARPLQNRLEAQGTVWCVTGGWKTTSVDGISVTTPELDEDAEQDILAAAHELEALGETERQAVVSARRGQGRYRNDLLKLWIGCAVTGCTAVELLRASHLKPWKLSSNAERLNPFNGLLLTPNLDIALDRWLISFTDEGSILISSSIDVKDAVALGIHDGMKLQSVKPEHKPFLGYHREEFLKREHSLKR